MYRKMSFVEALLIREIEKWGKGLDSSLNKNLNLWPNPVGKKA